MLAVSDGCATGRRLYHGRVEDCCDDHNVEDYREHEDVISTVCLSDDRDSSFDGAHCDDVTA